MSNLIFNMRVWRVHFQIARDWPFFIVGVNRYIDPKTLPLVAFY